LNAAPDQVTLVEAMGLTPFKMKSWMEGATTFVEMGGAIDERAQFGDVKATDKMVVNLEGVNFLNSVGTRSWCLWLQRFRAPAEVTLVRCPVIMVKSFASVKSFLTDRCVVQSFYIPFYSDKTGERKDFLMVRGTHFGTGEIKLPEIRDSAGDVMEMDVIPELYLSFIKPA